MIEYAIPIVVVAVFGMMGFAVSPKDPTPGIVFTMLGISFMWYVEQFPTWIFLVSLAGLALFMGWKFSQIWK